MDVNSLQGSNAYANMVLDFIESLDNSKTMSDLFHSLEVVANQLGFEGVSYTYIPPVILNNLQENSPVFVKSDAFSDGFISQYEEDNLGEHDFVIKCVLNNDLKPVHWWQAVEQRRVDRDEKRLIEIARSDYQIENAISIPTFKNGDSIAGVSITSSEDKYYFDKLFDERIQLFGRLCRIFSDRIILTPQYQANFYLPFLKKLSFTEKQLLLLLAEGVPLKRAAEKANIKYKYAGNVVERLRVKFGDVSRERLFYIAGLIRFHSLVNIGL